MSGRFGSGFGGAIGGGRAGRPWCSGSARIADSEWIAARIRTRLKVHQGPLAFLRRSLDIDHRKRYADACAMQADFRRLLLRVRRKLAGEGTRNNGSNRVDWNELCFKRFRAGFRKALDLDGRCNHRYGPTAESCVACPGCGTKVRRTWPLPGSRERCRHCGHGVADEYRVHRPWCRRRLQRRSPTHAQVDSRER